MRNADKGDGDETEIQRAAAVQDVDSILDLKHGNTPMTVTLLDGWIIAYVVELWKAA